MSSAVRILGTATAAATAAAAASGVRIGDFGLGDALALARDARRGPVILTLDLTRPLRVPDASGVAALRMRGRPTLREVVEALEAAAGDDRVVALLGRVGDTSTGLATVQQLRAALRTFAAGGKPTVVHSEAFGGESGNSTLPYLLATAFDEVHLQPTGLVTLLGIASEVTFLRDALDKAGITPQFEHRHEYKNAADPLTERDFTPAHREALAAVVDSWAGQIVGDIAAARRLDADAVRAAMDSAPLVAREMLEHGLVDRLAYHDETLAGLRARVPGDAELLPLADYVAAGRARQRWRARRAPAVALLDARGPIYPGRRSSGPLSGPVITSDRLGAALRRAADDDDIAAVLLHVDSPGGVVGASDAIRRAVLTTRHAGTPVVAWMGEVAASGGYYISMAADRIVAQPGTLTGSIGVVLGKAVTSGLEERLGLQTRAVISSANARFFSRTSPWTDEERGRVDTLLDTIYDDFTARVAEDRGMTRERVHELARGRIWTGEQAHAHGLVDHLGGYGAARDALRDLLGLPAGAPLRIHSYPPSPSLADRLRGREVDDPAERELSAVLAAVGGGSDALGDLRAAVNGDPGALGDLLERMLRPAGALTMPYVPRLR